MGIFRIIRITEDGKCVLGFLFHFLPQRNLGLPQVVYQTGQSAEGYQIVGAIGGCELLVPVLHFLDIVRLQALDDLIGVAAHAGIPQQEVIDLAVSGFLFSLSSKR